MPHAAIALGSNLGDRLEHLRAGVDSLERLGEVVSVSSVFETEPVGGPEQGRFLNAVVVLDTDLPPVELLDRLLDIERSRGRVREERWGPRTLDLDIVVYDETAIDRDRLQIPHPRAHERGFVVAPLVEVWPDAVLADGSTAARSWAGLDGKGLRRWDGAWRTEAPQLGVEAVVWVGAQIVLFAVWLGVVVLGSRGGPGPLRTAAGGVVAVSGLVVLEASRRALGRELTPFPQPRRRPRLVDRGVYARVRHPIYAGVVMVLAGTAIAVGSVPGVLATAVIGGFFAAKARVEERALSVGVPGYTDYLRRVPARFVPFGR